MVLADDEMLVRKGLAARLPVKEFGIEIVGVAEHGLQALEMCRTLRPDILFTDIRMPHMDGIELASTLKDEFPGLRILFFSGVQDFDYARSALEIQADGYILKPIHMDEVRRVLGKVVRQIELQRESERQFAHLRALLNENKDALRDHFLQVLLQGGSLTDEEIESRMRWYDLNLPDGEITCAIIEPDGHGRYDDMIEEERQLVLFSMRNIAWEVLGEMRTCACFICGDRQIALILCKSEEMSVSAVCEDIVSSIDRYLQQPVSIGIGSRVARKSEIYISFLDARVALKYGASMGPHTIISIEDIHTIRAEEREGMDTAWVYETVRQYESKILLVLRQRNRQLMRRTLEEIFNRLESAQLPLIYYKPLCHELMGMAGRLLFEQGNPPSVGDWSAWMNTIAAASDPEDLKRLVYAAFDGLAGQTGEMERSRNRSLINSIQSIVQQKYMQNITVQSIAKEVHFSPNYISSLFRNLTGQKLNDYITNVRIEHASRLLEETSLRIFEVAHAVGFENAQYFSTVFKKKMGRHPRSYRNDEAE